MLKLYEQSRGGEGVKVIELNDDSTYCDSCGLVKLVSPDPSDSTLRLYMC
jgi:hypothetical protein